MIGIRVEGGSLAGMGEQVLREMRPKAEAAVLASVLDLEGEIKRTLSQPGTGRIYGRHQASAPGDPPAVDTGRLRNSIAHTRPQWNGWEVSAEVGTNVEYAAALEFGTSRILPRPYMRPALEKARPRIEARLRRI